MFILMIITLFLSAGVLSCRYRERIQDTLTVAASGLILILYILAFFGAMRYVWIIAAASAAAGVWYAAGKKIMKDVVRSLADPIVPTLIIVVAAVTILTSDMIFTWWDDINFWSSDAKQLFYMNGFPGKYGNVSPEFGDYPPVTSIAKWIFLQFSPVTYRESLQFAGYFALNTVFLLPLHAFFHKLPSLKNRFLSCATGIFFFLVLIMLPGVFDGFAFYGTPADVTMALVYGALLLAIWDREGHEKAFYYGRIALYVSILMLTKSVGVEWAVFALVFYLVIAKREKQILISVIAGGGIFACWPVFCLIRRRVAKLTGAGVKMVTSGYSVPDDAGTRLGYFVDGAFTMPMHQNHNLTLDLPMAAALVVIFAIVIIMAQKKLINRQEMKKLILFLLVTAIIAFGIIFAAHISIFRTEDQYLDAYAMAVSIARYGCPFTLGSAMLLVGICFERAGKTGNMRTSVIVFAASAAAILLTADHTGMYRYLYGYRDSLDIDQAVIDEMIGDDGKRILEAVSEKGYWGRRILVLRDGTVNHRVHDTYISKAASPVALVYDDLIIPDDTFQSISDKIEKSHAGYVLAENSESEAGALFEAFMDEGVTYTAGRVYNVLYTPQGVRLSERDQTDGQ